MIFLFHRNIFPFKKVKAIIESNFFLFFEKVKSKILSALDGTKYL